MTLVYIFAPIVSGIRNALCAHGYSRYACNTVIYETSVVVRLVPNMRKLPHEHSAALNVAAALLSSM